MSEAKEPKAHLLLSKTLGVLSLSRSHLAGESWVGRGVKMGLRRQNLRMETPWGGAALGFTKPRVSGAGL